MHLLRCELLSVPSVCGICKGYAFKPNYELETCFNSLLNIHPTTLHDPTILTEDTWAFQKLQSVSHFQPCRHASKPLTWLRQNFLLLFNINKFLPKLNPMISLPKKWLKYNYVGTKDVIGLNLIWPPFLNGFLDYPGKYILLNYLFNLKTKTKSLPDSSRNLRNNVTDYNKTW